MSCQKLLIMSCDMGIVMKCHVCHYMLCHDIMSHAMCHVTMSHSYHIIMKSCHDIPCKENRFNMTVPMGSLHKKSCEILTPIDRLMLLSFTKINQKS